MEAEFVGFCFGLIAGAALMFFPALAVDHTSAWYKNGYLDGYEKGKREVEGEKRRLSKLKKQQN